jgi:hypothetical protein
MASFEITGTIKVIMDTQTFPSGFSKREFVITTQDDRFPQDIAFGCLKDKAALLDSVNVGQEVKVSFDISGREYNDRYFVNLNAWKIEPADAAAGGEDDQFPPVEDMGEPLPDADDNMPF